MNVLSSQASRRAGTNELQHTVMADNKEELREKFLKTGGLLVELRGNGYNYSDTINNDIKKPVTKDNISNSDTKSNNIKDSDKKRSYAKTSHTKNSNVKNKSNNPSFISVIFKSIFKLFFGIITGILALIFWVFIIYLIYSFFFRN